MTAEQVNDLHVGTGKTGVSIRSVQRLFDPIPVDVDVVSAYDEVDAAVRATGRQPRPRRMDLLIAATAVAHELPLATHHAGDFVGLEGLIRVIDLSVAL